MTGAAKPLLLIGASDLGRVLARHLAGPGMILRLTDIATFPDEVPPGASLTPAALAGGPAIRRLAKGCGAVVPFGGILVEQPFETVIGPDIRGLHHALVP